MKFIFPVGGVVLHVCVHCS